MKKTFHQEHASSFGLLKKPWNEPAPIAPTMAEADDRYADHIDHLDAIIAELQSELLRAFNYRARIRFGQGQVVGTVQ